ncbi:MAG: octaheme c-type cytochrome (tetrathionate reductase family) [Marinobacter maritimus]|jgi:octaheme c-type cytochrome (tetrathionate reductase family)
MAKLTKAHTATYLVISILAVLLMLVGSPGMAAVERAPATADHSKFKSLKGPFESASQVTEACLRCHTEAAGQIKATTHWTWLYQHEETGQTLGKNKVINSFCGMAVTNEPRCTSCHVGYGWKDMNQPPPEADSAVDCLVCHDTTGDYRKFPTLAGDPTYVPREWPKGSGKMVQPPDLPDIAQNVGATGRANCGSCHFYGGGGDGVKHGDLDSSLVSPARSLDVHMSPDGGNFSCSDCHSTWGHSVSGSRYQVNAKDTLGIDIPGHTDLSRASCESCHGGEPHGKEKLNDHVNKLACQTCHVPAFARGGVPTKMWWDWSTAGKLDENSEPIATYDDAGHVSYLSEKGDFRHGENVVPYYAWFDGTVEYTMIDEQFDIDNPPLEINRLDGEPNDPGSRIWPFKLMRGKQPFDTERKTLLATHVFGADDSSLWSNYDWPKALKFASDMSGMPFSGNFDFMETKMYWPITHMVPPADQALRCGSCHSGESRLAGIGGIYMPGHSGNLWLDRIGWLAVALTLAGVVLHGLARVVFRRRKQS